MTSRGIPELLNHCGPCRAGGGGGEGGGGAGGRARGAGARPRSAPPPPARGRWGAGRGWVSLETMSRPPPPPPPLPPRRGPAAPGRGSPRGEKGRGWGAGGSGTGTRAPGPCSSRERAPELGRVSARAATGLLCGGCQPRLPPPGQQLGKAQRGGAGGRRGRGEPVLPPRRGAASAERPPPGRPALSWDSAPAAPNSFGLVGCFFLT